MEKQGSESEISEFKFLKNGEKVKYFYGSQQLITKSGRNNQFTLVLRSVFSLVK